MSTRVQKGSAKFKPVTKARQRNGGLSSRHNSSIPDSGTESQASSRAQDTTHALSPTHSLRTSMPPPHSISDSSALSRSTQDTQTLESDVDSLSQCATRTVASTTSPPSTGVPGPVTISAPDRASATPIDASNRHPVQSHHIEVLSRETNEDESSLNLNGHPDHETPVVLTAGQPISEPVTLPPRPFIQAPKPHHISTVTKQPVPVQPPSVEVHARPSHEDRLPELDIDNTSAVQANISTIHATNATANDQLDMGNAKEVKKSKVKKVTKKADRAGGKVADPLSSQEKGFREIGATPLRPKRNRQAKSKKLVETAPVSDHISGEVGAAGEDVPAPKKRRKTTHKSRDPYLPPFDSEGEELDPTVVTMANICDDTGQGRISSKTIEIQRNHAAWKAANREKRARMQAIMEAKKYNRKENESEVASRIEETNCLPEKPHEDPTTEQSIARPSNTGGEPGEVLSRGPPSETGGEDPSGSGFNYSNALATNRYNVQVRIGPNGETIIDEESLYVDRAGDPEYVNEEYIHIEESDQTKFVNSQSYSKKARGSRWSGEETELFFDALSQFGENYELISYILPGRDRKSCKNKFKAEDKKNPNRITYCLNNRVPYDMQTLSRMTGKDFSGPTPKISAPEVLRLGEDEPSKSTSQTMVSPKNRSSRKKSRTPNIAESGVEVLGDVDAFNNDDEDNPDNASLSSNAGLSPTLDR